ncbi:hypothetical protein [Frigoribacterium sp. VKM Ac-2530]|uniref:hypothetical protein n=1 Tax=Frigoribacterium sp. VKM Ac-2530 TaxID=2783822 RepID=UPI00188B8DDD|nr:hypothetical protein [Frigoribacterium sp. VKM Ac-2530]
MTSRHRLLPAAALAAAALLTVTACTTSAPEPETAELTVATPQAAVTAAASGTAAERAVETSRALWGSSPVVVLARADDPDAVAEAAEQGERIGVPVLIAAEGVDVATEIDRLGAATVATVGEGPTADDLALGDVDAVPAADVEAPAARDADSSTLVVVSGPADAAASATARAAGAELLALPEGVTDLQQDASVVGAMGASETDSTLVVGSAFTDRPHLEWSVAAARSGAELPGGGQQFFPDRRFVALYGAPGTSALGVLGEQDVAATVQRAADTAAGYQASSDRPVVPMLELIATVAAGDAGPDGDYSNELDPDRLRPYVEAAAAAGQYVVLDLQPGRTDFLTQARRYESLLTEPNVGLALDPEWRLAPDQVPLRQIGGVDAAEVNGVSTWLADLVDAHSLPPKLFVLHQFRSSMLRDRAAIDLSRPELTTLVHVDGQGSQPDKQATWRALHDGAPAVAWGWKNFYDEDEPMLTPEQTMTEVSPVPDLVTYQ